MPSPSKEKGDRWERDLVSFLKAEGFPHATRLRQTGRDVGDLTIGSPFWALEAKDDKSLSPWAMASQAEREASHAGKPFGVALRKSPRRGPGEAVVLMTMATWVRLVKYMESEGSDVNR